MTELFRDGNWRLVRTMDHDKAGLQHRCDNDVRGDPCANWWYFMNEQCESCYEKPPEAIIGLHTLHNWDR